MKTHQSTLRNRNPIPIILCGCLIAILTFGPRATMGFFLLPMSVDRHWSREVFGLAIAVQHVVWGAGQPFAGAIADRFGIVRSISSGAVLYGAGLAVMAYAVTPEQLICAGVLVGLGLSGASFNIVLSAFGKLLPERHRSGAIGLGTAAGSFGQFLFAPLAVAMLEGYGWHNTLIVFAIIMLFILPLSLPLTTSGPSAAPTGSTVGRQSFRSALNHAFHYRSYRLLILGFFVCGFHVAFINMHLPSYLSEKGLEANWGGWVMALIGLFNIFGSVGAGWLSSRYPNRYVLFSIYFFRAATFLVMLLAPINPISALLLGAAIGLLWLSTIPPTSSLVALMFGTEYLATLFGIAFFFHQAGAFLGVWLGSALYEKFGSYDPVWLLAVFFALIAALANVPIVEKAVKPSVEAPAFPHRGQAPYARHRRLSDESK